MNVRRARVEDAEGIASVQVLTWQTAYRRLIPDEYLRSLAVAPRAEFWREVVQNQESRCPVWVAVADTGIVGFAAVGPSRDDRADESVGELYAMYVLHEHQGRGVGRGLMTVTSMWLRERFAEATLWVLEGKTRSRRFYERCGWRLDGATKVDDRGSFVLSQVRYRTKLADSERVVSIAEEAVDDGFQ